MQLEKKMEELEALVNKLEAPETTLEEGIDLYSRSLEITRQALTELKTAKNRITEIRTEMESLLENE